MYKLKNIYNSLSSFDKLFLELYYRVKFSKKSQRWGLLQILKKKDRELELAVFGKENTKEYDLEKNKGALSQHKRRLRFDIESILLLRVLNTSKSTSSNSRVLCHRLLLLAEHYLENDMPEEGHKKLKQAFKLITNTGLVYERLWYNEIKHQMLCLEGDSHHENPLIDSLSTLKMIELKLVSECDLITFRNSSFITYEALGKDYEEDGGHMVSSMNKTIVLSRKKMLSYWKVRDYLKASKLANELYLSIDATEPRWRKLRLECLLHLASLNVFAGDANQNYKIFEAIDTEFQLTKRFRIEYYVVQFLTYYLDSHDKMCQMVLHKMGTEIEKDPNNKDRDLLEFFKGLFLFKEGKYREVSKLLRNEIALFSLPDNMGLNVRLLELYALVMKGEYKLCTYKLEAFRQAVIRSKVNVKTRYMFIERMLYCFLSNEMNPSIVWKKYNGVRREYGENSERFKQDIEGYELISLEQFISHWELKKELNVNYEEVMA
ncbi:hypothetical protein DMA11_13690 [Marinilabiliaceae bacterium JC017]|nr:hypothetical protein DMA11_13690 [Marinilabiliaceae bacterium JC017]